MKVYVIKDEISKTRNQCLKNISLEASKKKVIDSKNIKKLYDAFVAREELMTTGFQDYVAIPHAQIDEIKKPSIIISIAKNKLKWESEDGKPIITAISLLIPKSEVSNLHIDILSKISTMLLDEEFRKLVINYKNKKEIIELIENEINSIKNKKENKETSKSDIFDIVGVSACATGVAHTYMAKDALEKEGKELGISIKIETQGQKGPEFVLSDKEIDNAKAVIIAADIGIDLERFHGKKVLKVKTNDAISNPEKVINASFNSEIYGQTSHIRAKDKSQTEFKSSKMKTFMGHLLTGVSRMIPFIVFSGILWAIFNSIGIADATIANDPAFKIAKSIAELGFGVFIAMMGGFIGESIAGRAAFAPAFIATAAASNSSLYFWWNVGRMKGIPQIDFFFPNAEADGVSNVGLSLFAAIAMGFAAGYLVKWVNSWNTHKLITPIMPIIFIPVVCSTVLAFPFIFLLSGPLGFLMNGLVYGIAEASKIRGVDFLMGCLLGAMIGFDMGGPVNKIAGTTATALIPIDPRLMGAVAAAIPIAPLGCALATFIGRRLFTDKERAEGISALGLGFFGISEGAIPFAVNRPKQVLLSNVVASAVAGGLAFAFFCGGYVGMWGGPITALVLGEHAPVTELAKLGIDIPTVFGGGGQPGTEFISILWFFVAIIAGSLLHAFMFTTMIKGKDSKFVQTVSRWFKRENKEQNV